MSEDTNMGIILGIAAVIVFSAFFMLFPIYNVWASEQSGRAELARADYSKRVAVVEAQAKLDSASLLADAEVARAGGVARANTIIGESLKGHVEYLQYLWITQLEKSTHETIYVPTEAQIPILEAGRFGKMIDIKLMNVGNDALCKKLCIYRLEGGYPPCGRKDKCVLYDENNVKTNYYEEQVI